MKMTTDHEKIFASYKTKEALPSISIDCSKETLCNKCNRRFLKETQINGLCPECWEIVSTDYAKQKADTLKEIILSHCEGAGTQELGFHIDTLDDIVAGIQEFYTEEEN
jgi:threonine synthase